MSYDELKPPAFPFHPDQVLSDPLLAALEGVSVDTLQRERAREMPRRASDSPRGGTARACVTIRRGSIASAKGKRRDDPPNRRGRRDAARRAPG